MQVQIKKLPKSQIEIQVEVPTEEWHKYLNLAAKNLAQGLRVSGFRQGQAPRAIVERELGANKVLSEAAELCCRKTYVQVLTDKEIETIGPPKITVLKMAEGNSFCYKAETAVLPEVILPDYKKLARQMAIKKPVVKIKEIEAAINYLRKSRAKLITLARPAQKGDCVTIDFSLTYPGQQADEFKDQQIVIGENVLVPEFEEQLVGMSEHQEKEFTIKMPAILKSQENQRGEPAIDNDLRNLPVMPSEAPTKVRMKLVQKIVLPQANDELARSLGKFKNLAALRKSLQSGILIEKQAKEKERWRLALMGQIAEQAQMDVPDVLISQEQEKMMQEFQDSLRGLNLSLKDYLAKINKTELEVRESFLKNALQRARLGLCLKNIAQKEKIQIPEADIEDEINKFLSQYADTDQVRKNIDLEALRVYTKGVLENEQVFQLLEKFHQS